MSGARSTPALTCIVGLPGSGKTTLAGSMGRFVDDPRDLSEVDEAIRTDGSVIVADPNLIYPRARECAEARYGPIRWVFFENDPEACWVNLQRRGDGRVDRATLLKMSRLYTPPEGAVSIPVWRSPMLTLPQAQEFVKSFPEDHPIHNFVRDFPWDRFYVSPSEMEGEVLFEVLHPTFRAFFSFERAPTGDHSWGLIRSAPQVFGHGLVIRDGLALLSHTFEPYEEWILCNRTDILARYPDEWVAFNPTDGVLDHDVDGKALHHRLWAKRDAMEFMVENTSTWKGAVP